MESLEAVRKKITELEQEAAQAKGDKELYLVLQKRLAALQAKEERLAAQGVLTRADSNWACKRRRKISLWDQTESHRGRPSNGCGRMNVRIIGWNEGSVYCSLAPRYTAGTTRLSPATSFDLALMSEPVGMLYLMWPRF